MDRKNLLSAIITAAALTMLFIYANLAWADAGVEKPRIEVDGGIRNALRTLERSGQFSRLPAEVPGPSGTLRNVPCPSKKLRKLMERDVETRRSEIATRLVGLAAARVATMVDYDALPLRSEMPRVRNSL